MIHPEARSLLSLIADNKVPPTHTLEPAEARRMYRDRRTSIQPEPPVVGETLTLSADSLHGAVPLRLYKPLLGSSGELPTLVYFHGGGWVIGDLETHDTLCRELANAANCAVVAVDYRLAPEYRFPAAVDDAFAAVRWVFENGKRFGLDVNRIAVGGDSAGGNLAAVTSIHMRDEAQENDPKIVFQLLLYPVTDMRRVHASHSTNGDGYVLTSDTLNYFARHYLRDASDEEDWRVSPLLAPNLSGLPQALVVTAGFDPLRDEGLAYADALSAAGNSVSYVCFDRQIHGFVPMGRVFTESRTAIALCAAELRRVFQNS